MIALAALVFLLLVASGLLYELLAHRRSPPADPDRLTQQEWQAGMDAIDRQSLPAAIEAYRRQGPLAAADLRRAERRLRELRDRQP